MALRRVLVSRLDWVILAASLILTAAMFMIFAMRLDIEDSRLAFDWKILWSSMENGHVQWDKGMYNPPWAIMLLLPLAYLPLEAGWGFMMFFLLVTLLWSVPATASRRQRWICIVLLVTAYPVMRDYVDANVEPFVLAGALLLLVAYQHRRPVLVAVAVLLCTFKPQATFLLLIFAAFLILPTWPRRDLWRIGAAILAVVIPAMIWQGRPWLNSLLDGSPTHGISMQAVWTQYLPEAVVLVVRMMVVGITLAVAFWRGHPLSHLKAAMLIAASLLAAPYSQALSLVVVLALGVIPLILARPSVGIPLLVLYNFPYVGLLDLGIEPDKLHWNAVLTLTWGVLLWHNYRTERPAMAVWSA